MLGNIILDIHRKIKTAILREPWQGARGQEGGGGVIRAALVSGYRANFEHGKTLEKLAKQKTDCVANYQPKTEQS